MKVNARCAHKIVCVYVCVEAYSRFYSAGRWETCGALASGAEAYQQTGKSEENGYVQKHTVW